MPVKGLTPEEIAAATAAVVAAGGKSTDRANRLPGETATEANARITAAYKNQPKPELSQKGKEAGATIQFVRSGAGGVGTYKEVFPIGGGVTPVSPTTTTVVTPQAGTGIYQMLNGILYFDGKPFTGNWNGQNWQNGKSSDVTVNPDTEDFVSSTGSVTSTTSAGQAERQSAYDLLLQQFNQYGLGSLVEPLKNLITSGASPAEFTIKLRESDAYKKRFAANAARVAKGLTAISEAEYIGLEDQYQNIMRNYGLPANYYTRGDMGRQEGFEKFIGNDVSAAELEDRIMTAQNRVMNANPEVVASLRQFYPDISNGDILAYALDPDKGLSEIKRKVTAAEIGGGAMQAGLGITGTRAEELGAAGVTKQQAQQGFQTVAEVFPRGGQLAAIYGESPYTQQTAEQEVFGLAGSTEAAKQRRKLVGLERAAFSGQTGAAQGALGRERAGNL